MTRIDKKHVILSIVLLAGVAFAGNSYLIHMRQAFQPAEGGAGPDPVYWEKFETNPGTDVTWDFTGGTPDPDFSTAPFEGAEMAEFSLADQYVMTDEAGGTMNTSVWIYAIVDPRKAPGNEEMFQLRDQAFNTLLIIQGNAVEGGAILSGMSFKTISTGGFLYTNQNHVLINYTTDLAGSETASLWVETTADFSGAADITDTGSTTVTNDDILVGWMASGSGGAVYMDDIRIGATRLSVLGTE